MWNDHNVIPLSGKEVLAEVKGFKFAKYVVLRYDFEHGWWQHIPKLGTAMDADGWIGISGLTVVRWQYIDEYEKED